MSIWLNFLIDFTPYDYPGIYQYNDFHHCNLTHEIDYSNRTQVQTCDLMGLSEYALFLHDWNKLTFSRSLATDTPNVQERIANYFNDLLSLGVDGLRIDAAKREWSLVREL